MRLPWDNSQKLEENIQELEEKISELEDEKENLRKRFESEQERRRKLSRKKQNAEEELNRLKDRLETEKKTPESSEEPQQTVFSNISFRRAIRTIRKIGSVSSEDRDLVTVYSGSELVKHPDSSGVKNSIPSETFEKLGNTDRLIIFHDEDLNTHALRLRPFFDDLIEVDDSFHTSELQEFIDTRKHWVLISRGNTRVYSEESGEFEQLEHIRDRINRQHGKGGFSQARFERKRDEQVADHLERVEEAIDGLENVYLLGEQDLCSELEGVYLGGFDRNSSPPEVFYQPERHDLS